MRTPLSGCSDLTSVSDRHNLSMMRFLAQSSSVCLGGEIYNKILWSKDGLSSTKHDISGDGQEVELQKSHKHHKIRTQWRVSLFFTTVVKK